MLLPGFHDSHVHPVTGGLNVSGCYPGKCKTAGEIYQKVRECAENHLDIRINPWIRGRGLQLPLFPGIGPGKARGVEQIPERSRWLYPIRSVMKSGAIVASRARD